MSLMQRTAKHFMLIKAGRQIKQEIEKAGLDKLEILVGIGRSIVGTYLNGCSAQEKATYRRDLKALFHLGVTPDMLLGEVTRQIPGLAPIMEGKENYKRSERLELERFLKEG